MSVVAQTCTERRRLRDAYLMALAREDALHAASRSGDVAAREITDAHAHLVVARRMYWIHVNRHGCWREKKRPAALRDIRPVETQSVPVA